MTEIQEREIKKLKKLEGMNPGTSQDKGLNDTSADKNPEDMNGINETSQDINGSSETSDEETSDQDSHLIIWVCIVVQDLYIYIHIYMYFFQLNMYEYIYYLMFILGRDDFTIGESCC